MAGLRQQQPARFLSIPDLLASSDPSQEGLLRIIGRLEAYDIEHSILWLQDHKAPLLQVAVDSSNIQPFPFKQGLLYQFIGEVDYRDIPIAAGVSKVHIPIATVDHRDAPTADDNTATSDSQETPATDKDKGTIIDNMEMYAPVATSNQTMRCVVMKALLCRCVDGLDMDVYVRAHEARMRLISTATDSA